MMLFIQFQHTGDAGKPTQERTRKQDFCETLTRLQLPNDAPQTVMCWVLNPLPQFSSFWHLFWILIAHMSSTPWPLSVKTMRAVALTTLSQWPHQRTTQKNRNDRLFIIAQPLCRRGKSIIKTRLTAKITAVPSIVLERANFFFSSRVSWPVRHHLGAICSPSQIPLPFGIGFTWLIHTVNGLSLQWKKERDSVWNCLRSQEVLDSSGTSLCLPLTFQQEECPHYRERLGASGRGWSAEVTAQAGHWNKGTDARMGMGMMVREKCEEMELHVCEFHIVQDI